MTDKIIENNKVRFEIGEQFVLDPGYGWDIVVTIVKTSKKAVCLQATTGKKTNEMWLPKSAIKQDKNSDFHAKLFGREYRSPHLAGWFTMSSYQRWFFEYFSDVYHH